MYTTKVKLGSPQREYIVLIETGSDLLWVNCNQCNNCRRSNGLGFKFNFFDTLNSSTSALIYCSDRLCSFGVQGVDVRCLPPIKQCTYTYGYQDHSTTSSVYVTDEMLFDMILGQPSPSSDNSSATVFFGCGTHLGRALIETPTAFDGIFGFGPGPMSVVSQLSAREIISNAFSHCLKGDGNGGGILALGAVVEPSIVYSPLAPSKSHYYMNLESIVVNGQLLSIDPVAFSPAKYGDRRGTTIDSGTTLAYLFPEVYNPLVNACR